ncbi:CST complex subunit CTC1 [Bienertia sinuspersici]
MEDIHIIPISDLLKRRRPISGASSLLNSYPPTTSLQSSHDSKTLNPSSMSHPKILKSLSKPSMIIGTLSLPITNNSLSYFSSFHHSCFSFSDDSGSVCCDVLHFDVRMIRTKIRILAWNFIPFKQCGGLLEIIKWEFFQGFEHGSVGSFHLGFDDNVDNEKDGDKKSKHCVYGVLRSVSPISLVPCLSDSVSKNASGFLVEILVCNCGLCNSEDGLRNYDDCVLGRNAHDFCTVKYVYFSAVLLCWYPVFVKLVGNVVLLVGLKKKLVYIGKEEAELMFVSNELTCLSVPSTNKNEDYLFKNGKAKIKGKGELGMYVGVVRGIYMQGMVVELDEEVWLLVTDESLQLPHSVRVGSILSLRNVHIVSPKFQWGKMLILGACCKTNISAISYSPLETGCQLGLRSSSLLGKFLESLVFPARLWVLLLVQCLRKKFSGVFSEREILGTKHTEGLVHTYARFILPSPALQSRHGNFMEFCKHGLCGCGSNIYYGSLSLAIPLSHLVKYSERMSIKSLLQIGDGLKILEGSSQVDHPVRGIRSSDQLIRRILPSKGLGVSLLGNLKICPTTGRLQYVDATGNIDAVVPDIPSTWDANAIYEVYNYNLVLEGTPETWCQFWRFEDDLYSCSSLFKTIMIKRQTELTVYVHFCWSNVSFRHFATHQDPISINSSAKLDPGTFHLLFLAHKFPLQRQLHGDVLIAKKSSFFAEVIVLPWDLNVAISEFTAPLTKVAQDDLESGYQNDFAFKRCKTHQSYIDKVGSCSSFEESGKRSCGQSSNFPSLPHKTRSINNFSSPSLVQVPCKVTGRAIHGQCMAVPGLLCIRQKDGNCDMLGSRKSRKVLLEFNAESFFKYKLLQIGGIYITKHCAEKCICDPFHINQGSSISITSQSKFWSMYFHFGEAIDIMSGLCNDPSSASGSSSESSTSFHLHNELVISPCNSADYRTFSDVILHVEADADGLLGADVGLKALKELAINLSQRSADISNTVQQVGCGGAVAGFFERQGLYSGNDLPEGSLVSLKGTVVSLHNSDSCSIDRSPCNRVAHNVHQPRYYEEKEGSIYMCVLTDGHLVIFITSWAINKL